MEESVGLLGNTVSDSLTSQDIVQSILKVPSIGGKEASMLASTAEYLLFLMCLELHRQACSKRRETSDVPGAPMSVCVSSVLRRAAAVLIFQHAHHLQPGYHGRICAQRPAHAVWPVV